MDSLLGKENRKFGKNYGQFDQPPYLCCTVFTMSNQWETLIKHPKHPDNENIDKTCSSLRGRGSRTFLPGFLHSLENPPHITTIVKATLLSQSKDQNNSHVSKEQMSYQLGWCEHRYNADRKLRQSLVEPIMGRTVGAGLQTLLFLCCATLRYMINFLTKSTQAARGLPSL